jgi:hypothetical protein
MPQKSLSKAALVLVELGAAWPATLVARAGRVSYRVLAEVEGEGPLAFAARAEAFCASAFPRGTQVSTALVACNQRGDETAEVSRRALAESLLAGLAPDGSIFFAGEGSASDRFRRRLYDLASELDAAVGGEGRVGVWFSAEASRTDSGPVPADAAQAGAGVARVA